MLDPQHVDVEVDITFFGCLAKVYSPTKGNPLEPTDTSIICLNCGYDLRGTVGNRCSECGKEFSREDYRPSALPWECEHSGPFRYFRTVLKVFYGKQNFFEIHRDHDPAKASKFRRLALAFFIVALVLAYLALMTYLQTQKTSPGQLLLDEAGNVILHIGDLNLASTPAATSFPYDFLLFFGLGLEGLMGWILPLFLLPLLARDWVYGLSDALRMKSDSPEANNRARLLGCYMASFPAFLLLIALIGVGVQIAWCFFGFPNLFEQLGQLGQQRRLGTQPPVDIPILNFLGHLPWILGLLITPIFAVIRLCQWRNGIYGRENVSVFNTLAKLSWIYLWRAFFWIILIPCFAGFMRLCYLGLFVW